jgi:signal transduction histidine kinase
MVRRMATASTRLHQLIDSILEYARLESGQLVTCCEPIDLLALAAGVVDELRPQAEGKRLSLVATPAADLPPLESDPRLVRLIVVNLVGNAVKYTERGTVRVTLSHAGNAHRLAVQDTGPGIPLDRQSFIFEPFEQLEPVRQKHSPGVGLGLAIVRELAEALGGRIELDSTVGDGSTFTVVLPRLTPRPSSRAADEERLD